MPVAFALCITGCLGMIVTIGFTGTMTQLGLVPYASVASYVVSIIPLFALMGNLAFVSGLVIDVYRAGDKWLGALPGGLAMGSIAGCTGFAAVSGSSVAAVGMLAESALPEMLRYKYAPKLATGCIAAGATLGILIPPSGPMVVYGLLSEASIGKLFMAGIVPGLCLAFLYLILIYVSCRLKPEMGPRGPKSTLR
ncbi:MAG: TRAP transporter large permease subunit, partial [Peptococcaceae bacterium]|nr:TRAP transporter large permease subunit [Peptococcaceae bacterium]